MKKLNLKPFEYGLKLNAVYDDGAILPESIINFNPETLLEKIQEGVRNIAGLSLSAGYPIEATVPIIIANGFRNIAALSLESGYIIILIQFQYSRSQRPHRCRGPQKRRKERSSKGSCKEIGSKASRGSSKRIIGLSNGYGRPLWLISLNLFKSYLNLSIYSIKKLFDIKEFII